jgi:hypothetical protein
MDLSGERSGTQVGVAAYFIPRSRLRQVGRLMRRPTCSAELDQQVGAAAASYMAAVASATEPPVTLEYVQYFGAPSALVPKMA